MKISIFLLTGLKKLSKLIRTVNRLPLSLNKATKFNYPQGSAKPLDTDRKTRFRSTPVLSEKVAPHSTLTFAIDIDLCELQAKHASTPR